MVINFFLENLKYIICIFILSLRVNSFFVFFFFDNFLSERVVAERKGLRNENKKYMIYTNSGHGFQ